MPSPNADEILMQRHLRAWTQRGGARPGNAVRYAGKNDQYLSIDSGDNPVRGGINPMYVHDPLRRNAYRLIGSSVDTPDLPSATVTFRQKHGALSWVRGDLSCPVTFYEHSGTCTRPDDFLNGWSDMVTIYSSGLATDRSGANRVSFDGDDAAQDEIGFTFSAIYDVGSLTFGSNADTMIAREIVDVVYGGGSECGSCGPANNGAKWLYALQQAATGVAANVIYSTDSGATWGTSTITGLAVNVLADAIAVAGNTLIVASSADNAYYATDLNARTGAPGAWTKVTAGFLAASGPTDIYVAGAAEVYFSGKQGVIYRATNLYGGVSVVATPAATDLNRIHGLDDTLVVVGASNTIYKSTNRGRTWAAPVAGLTGTLTAVFVMDAYQYWVGTAAGGVSYTQDGGESWRSIALPGAAATVIRDIVFATTEVGYIAGGTSGTSAALYATYNGGQDWIGASSPRLPVVGTYNALNRIAIPASSDPMTVANTLMLGGLNGGGTDGMLLTGAANILG